MPISRKIAIILVFFAQTAFGQLAAPTPVGEHSLVNWMTIEEAMTKYQTQPRPIIMDFYTDWCGWCKRMMATTYSDPGLSSYINAYFYPVKFDAEGKDTVEYLGQKYMPTSMQPRTTHPLAAKLLQNKLMYPTTLFLNGYDKEKKEFKLSMLAAGYLETQKLEPILIFSLENAFRNSNYDEFRVGFEKTFHDSMTMVRSNSMNWLTPKAFFNGDSVKTKKTIVLFNADWCNSGKVMKTATFTDSTTMDIMKTKFNLVEFNPEIKDTLIYKGRRFFGTANQSPYHALSFEITRGGFAFPSVVFLNEKMEVIDVINSYINPKFMEMVAHFYGDDAYKTKSWQEFSAAYGK